MCVVYVLTLVRTDIFKLTSYFFSLLLSYLSLGFPAVCSSQSIKGKRKPTVCRCAEVQMDSALEPKHCESIGKQCQCRASKFRACKAESGKKLIFQMQRIECFQATRTIHLTLEGQLKQKEKLNNVKVDVPQVPPELVHLKRS